MTTLVKSLGSHLSVVRAVVAICQPGWLGIRNFAQFTDNATVDNAVLSFDSPDLEASVLGSGDHIVSVESVEGIGGVLSTFRHLCQPMHWMLQLQCNALISSSSKTEAPPGCKFLNFVMS